jgi:hypothetical protein
VTWRVISKQNLLTSTVLGTYVQRGSNFCFVVVVVVIVVVVVVAAH